MILLHGESFNFSTTLPSMAAGGKAYASRSSHGRLSASTVVARGSSTGDTNRGNLLLNLVAKRSIFGRCHLLHIVWKTSGRRDHSVWMVRPNLDSLSATTFSWPGMCRALRVTSFLVHQVKILHSRAQSGPDLMLLPCLCMTPLWCCLLLQVLSCLSRGLRTLLRLGKLLCVLDNLYAACFPEGTRLLFQCAHLSENPTLLLMHL